MRVREFEVAGVRGALYRKGMFAPAAVEDVNLAYDRPQVFSGPPLVSATGSARLGW